MGFNTAVMVLNDRLHEIEEDPTFPARLRNAIISARRDERQYTSGFQVLPFQHADTMQIVAVGGNSMRLLGYGAWNNTDEQLLKALAEQHGFTLTKRRVRERPLPLRFDEPAPSPSGDANE